MFQLFTIYPYLWVPVFALFASLAIIASAFLIDWVEDRFIIYYPLWIPAVFLILLAIAIFAPIVFTAVAGLFAQVFVLLFQTILLWLPFVLLSIFWKLWRTYIRRRFIFKLKWILLEPF